MITKKNKSSLVISVHVLLPFATKLLAQ